MSDARAHLETLALHFGAPAPAVGVPVSPPAVAATSFYTAPGEVGFSAADMTDEASYSTRAGAIRLWPFSKRGLLR